LASRFIKDSGIFKAITQFKKDDCVDNKQNDLNSKLNNYIKP